MKISISEIGDKKKIIRQMLNIYFSQGLLAQLVEKNMRDDFALLMDTETIKSLEKYPIEKKGDCVYDPNSAIKNRFCGIFFDVVKQMPSPMQNTSKAERKFIYAFPDEINIPKDELGGKIITVTHLYAGPLKKKYPKRLIKKHELARQFFADKEDVFRKILSGFSPREEDMIKMRFGIRPYHRPHTYQEVSRSFGVVMSRVVGLEEKVKEKFDLDVDLGFTKRDEGSVLLDMG